MKYSKFVSISFAVSCAFLLESFIGFGGDLIYAPAKPKAPGYVVATGVSTQAAVHKYVPVNNRRPKPVS